MLSNWVKDRRNLWFSKSGYWGPKGCPMLDQQRMNPLEPGANVYFQPYGVIVLGPSPLNPDRDGYRLFVSSAEGSGEWFGPFNSFEAAAELFAVQGYRGLKEEVE